jgi:hypothetical protein
MVPAGNDCAANGFYVMIGEPAATVILALVLPILLTEAPSVVGLSARVFVSGAHRSEVANLTMKTRFKEFMTNCDASLKAALIVLLSSGLLNNCLAGSEAQIVVRADHVSHAVSPYLTGACLEDVNHEVYGGIYSQMIFGESFQEPAASYPLVGLTSYGGNWTVQDDALSVAAGPGSKLIADRFAPFSGEASVELNFTKDMGGNAGLIVNVSRPGVGPDAFSGYEISVAPAGYVVLGRHRQNFESISRMPCAVPLNQWINLKVAVTNEALAVFLNGQCVTQYVDKEFPLSGGQVGLRNWQQDVRFRNLSLATEGVPQSVAFVQDTGSTSGGVSGMWTAFKTGSATGQCSTVGVDSFVGTQCQRLTFSGGTGQFGIANRGLNRQGMFFAGDKPYEGCLWARSATPAKINVSLESDDGSEVLAEQELTVTSNGWQRLEFQFAPVATKQHGRFCVTLKQPGSVDLGYAFLQPGEWGRFHGLPVRRDVAEGLLNQGVTVLRYGGSMVNAAGYRWKKMIGPRDQRPPYTGTWYPYSSDGWGIFDFLNFCEAAGIMPIPAFNMGEEPQDMADFIDYVNGSTNTVWGARRAADGHPGPYHLAHIELGNEERVDEAYFLKFKRLAEAIWAKDPDLILTVGDFAYSKPINDPFHFRGADSGITSLAAQQEILQLARQYDREVWFDLHVWTDGPLPTSYLAGMFSYDDALGRLANGAKYKVVVYELNANNHEQRRALANALAINAAERDGRLPVITSANCLQPDRQNDNGWDQGLLFLNPSQVWLQPPGYVTQMKSATYLPHSVETGVTSPGNCLDVSAKASDDRRTLVLQVVNTANSATPASIRFDGFRLTDPAVSIRRLAGALSAVNTADRPLNISVSQMQRQFAGTNGTMIYDFAPTSFTVLTFKGQPDSTVSTNIF